MATAMMGKFVLMTPAISALMLAAIPIMLFNAEPPEWTLPAIRQNFVAPVIVLQTLCPLAHALLTDFLAPMTFVRQDHAPIPQEQALPAVV